MSACLLKIIKTQIRGYINTKRNVHSLQCTTHSINRTDYTDVTQNNAEGTIQNVYKCTEQSILCTSQNIAQRAFNEHSAECETLTHSTYIK